MLSSTESSFAQIAQHGDGLDNSLGGTDGDDALYGEGGNDQLFDSPGTDLLDGGDGNDRLYVDFQRLVYDFNISHYTFVTNLSAGDQLIGGSGSDSIIVRSDVCRRMTDVDNDPALHPY